MWTIAIEHMTRKLNKKEHLQASTKLSSYFFLSTCISSVLFSFFSFLVGRRSEGGTVRQIYKERRKESRTERQTDEQTK